MAILQETLQTVAFIHKLEVAGGHRVSFRGIVLRIWNDESP
jgi:hypothetical protein